MSELTFWVTPFTALTSLSAACETIVQRTPDGWHGNLLLPTHYGKWSQAECRQSLPPSMLVASPDDITAIRQEVEGRGLGFGSWGVPHDLDSPVLAAEYARVSGYYAANFEPNEFWTPGDNPDAVNEWWQTFWDTLGADSSTLDGNVAATVIPNDWGLSAFENSAHALEDGCNALSLEVYGGPNTSRSYPYPNLWPTQAYRLARPYFEKPFVPILALANLDSQLEEANGLSDARVEVWAI